MDEVPGAVQDTVNEVAVLDPATNAGAVKLVGTEDAY